MNGKNTIYYSETLVSSQVNFCREQNRMFFFTAWTKETSHRPFQKLFNLCTSAKTVKVSLSKHLKWLKK